METPSRSARKRDRTPDKADDTVLTALSPTKLRKTRAVARTSQLALGRLASLPDELLAVVVPRWLCCVDVVSYFATCRALAGMGATERTWRALVLDFRTSTAGTAFDQDVWMEDMGRLQRDKRPDIRVAYQVLTGRHVLHRTLPYLVWCPEPDMFAYQLRKNRATLLDWLLEVSEHLKCSARTPFMAAMLLEQFRARTPPIPLQELQGVGGACLIRAMAMYGDELTTAAAVPSTEPATAFSYLCDNCYTPERMRQFVDRVEQVTGDVVDQDMLIDYVRRLLAAARKYPDSESVTFATCSFISELVLVSTEAFRFPVPAMAAAIFSFVCFGLGLSSAWVRLMSSVSGYTLRELQEPMMLVHVLVRDSVVPEETRRSMTPEEKRHASCVALIPQLPSITSRYWRRSHLRASYVITKDLAMPPPPEYGMGVEEQAARQSGVRVEEAGGEQAPGMVLEGEESGEAQVEVRHAGAAEEAGAPVEAADRTLEPSS